MSTLKVDQIKNIVESSVVDVSDIASKNAFNADTGASLVGFKANGTGAVASTVQDKLRESVSVKDFGAVGDGVTDDTAAIVSALAVGKDVMFPTGTYRLSPTSAQSIANQGNQRMYGQGSVALKIDLAGSTDVFRFLGPVCLENLTIDFNSKSCKTAFAWDANAGHIRIKNVRVYNLRDTVDTTSSSTFNIRAQGNSFSIDGVTASSMLKKGNGTITDGAGSYNLIYIWTDPLVYTGPTIGEIRNVTVIDIHNINTDGSVIYEDTAAIYIITGADDQTNVIKVSGIAGYNFGKRLIKVHASNVEVSNVVGYSVEGDSLGVIGFLSGEGLGDKYGSSAKNVKAIGLMEYAFATSAFGVKFSNVSASIQPGTKAGMSNAAVGLLISGNDTVVDGFWSDSERDIGIGAAAPVKNTTLKNITLRMNANKAPFSSIYNVSTTNGFDGMLIDGVNCTVESGATNTACISLINYMDGTTKKGRNLIIRNIVQESAGPVNSYFVAVKYIENLSIENLKYSNTSGLSHFRLVSVENSSNVNVDDVDIEGVNQIGVYLKDCTGRNTVSRVTNQSASIAAAYNQNSTEFLAFACDHTKVSGITTSTPQTAKSTSGTTANRPTTGLVAGYSQHFDTTLGKPIWWNGSSWKDATGTTV